MWISLERGRETKPCKTSQLVGFSSECSQWLLGLFRCYNSEPQIPAGWRNNNCGQSCSNLVFLPRLDVCALLLLSRLEIPPGRTDGVGGEKCPANQRKAFLCSFLFSESHTHWLFSFSPILWRGCSSSGCSSRSVAVQIRMSHWSVAVCMACTCASIIYTLAD